MHLQRSDHAPETFLRLKIFSYETLAIGEYLSCFQVVTDQVHSPNLQKSNLKGLNDLLQVDDHHTADLIILLILILCQQILKVKIKKADFSTINFN